MSETSNHTSVRSNFEQEAFEWVPKLIESYLETDNVNRQKVKYFATNFYIYNQISPSMAHLIKHFTIKVLMKLSNTSRDAKEKQ